MRRTPSHEARTQAWGLTSVTDSPKTATRGLTRVDERRRFATFVTTRRDWRNTWRNGALRASGSPSEDIQEDVDHERDRKKPGKAMKEPNGQPRTVCGHPESESSACDLRRERYGSCSGESLREPGEHREVGVKLDAGEAANAERSKPVLVLQAAELALD